ncbi:phosphotransferase family protein [Patulibacter minatonensis]|uniref:phosphotransferase family protein n=1 Tax=Patulibacter minatonensis TaxID=298163 RepID=UPI00047CA7E4|nr:phosphotransferase family protein [Patulibacter minatonensis]
MALINQLEETSTGEALARWLDDKLDGQVEVTDVVVPKESGMSMSTVLFKASVAGTDYDLVARVAPAGSGLFEPDLEREFGVLALVGAQGVTVPKVRWLEQDASVLGAPFLVMDRIDGQVPGDDPPFTMDADGWVLALAPEQRGTLWSEAIRVMAGVHAVDAKEAGSIHGLDPDAAGIDAQLAAWERYYRWTCGEGRTSAVVDGGFAWLREHRPATDGDPVLNWGDARLGNIIYGPDQQAVAALDWELTTIAEPGFDLGWFVLFIRFYGEAMGVAIPDGMPTREEVVAQYEEVSGRTAQNIDWWEAFAAVRLAAMFVRMGTMMVESGALPPDNQMWVNNPSSHMLSALLDLPAPDGESSNFIGNR